MVTGVLKHEFRLYDSYVEEIKTVVTSAAKRKKSVSSSIVENDKSSKK